MLHQLGPFGRETKSISKSFLEKTCPASPRTPGKKDRASPHEHSGNNPGLCGPSEQCGDKYCESSVPINLGECKPSQLMRKEKNRLLAHMAGRVQ